MFLSRLLPLFLASLALNIAGIGASPLPMPGKFSLFSKSENRGPTTEKVQTAGLRSSSAPPPASDRSSLAQPVRSSSLPPKDPALEAAEYLVAHPTDESPKAAAYQIKMYAAVQVEAKALNQCLNKRPFDNTRDAFERQCYATLGAKDRIHYLYCVYELSEQRSRTEAESWCGRSTK